MDQLLPLLPTVLGCALALAAGGLVKGVISLGLPLVGMPLLLFAVDVHTALNLLMIPLVLSNLFQAFEGTGTLAVLKRFWPVVLCLSAGVLIGTGFLATLDQRLLLLIVGAFTTLFGIISLTQPHLAVPPKAEPWLGPPVALAAGVIGGMSTLFGPLLAIYIVGLRLDRETFVKTISLLYTIGSVVFLLGNTAHGTTDLTQLGISAAAMIPVYAGMMLGRLIRHRMAADKFRIAVLSVVILTGANMIRAGLT
jgi:uncharacterized membrane protein YfcA